MVVLDSCQAHKLLKTNNQITGNYYLGEDFTAAPHV